MTDTHTDPLLDVTWLAQDDMIVRWVRQTSQPFEPSTTRWMLDHMARTPGAFVDVGASTGWFAVPMAKRGYPVIAFECNARSIQRLRENCALNDVTIVLHEMAASDRSGAATFRHNGRLPLTSGGSLEPVAANHVAETVSCGRLDDHIDERVALIKIDVEGHEAAVLAGAEHTIAMWRPALVLEANTPQHMAALTAWCREHRYDWRVVDARNLLCLPAS